MAKVFIDPGHGGKDPGAIGNGLQEKDINLAVSLELGKILKQRGLDVLYSRTNDVFSEPSDRAVMANKASADIFVSIHCNAAENKSARGVETYSYPGSPDGAALSRQIQNSLAAKSYTINRGTKTANFAVLRLTKMPAVLVELAFIGNIQDANILKTQQKQLAEAVAAGVLGYLKAGATPTTTPSGMLMLGKTKATVGQMQAWARAKGANQLLIDLAPIFYDVSSRVGVNPLIAYVQSAKETNYMKFGGVLDASFKNPCGLKITAGGGNNDPGAHQRFKSWEEGIQAQVDHLALYAGAPGYPKPGTPDPRHFAYLKGTAPTVESLGGKWAPSATYGSEIVKMVREIEGARAPAPAPPPAMPKGGIALSDIRLDVRGKRSTVKGIVLEGTNYLPVRFLEELGFKVTWDPVTKTVVIR